MNPQTIRFLAAFGLIVLASESPASGIAFRLIVGAPPDPYYQEVSGDGVAALPLRGYSPGYGYPSDYMKMPSLVITNERAGHGYVEVVESAGDAQALIRVRVPAGAQVWFGGQPTAQGGGERLFQSPPLRDGVLL